MELSKRSASRVASVFQVAELGDPRRTHRLVYTVASLARDPTASVPAACVDDAATQGTYRLVNNRRVTFDALIETQAVRTCELAEAAGDVLVLHDTTDCGFSHLDPEELGYLNTGKAGFRLHASLVVEANVWRRPLGVIAAETVHRAQPSRRGSRKASGSDSAARTDKEFARWHRGLSESGRRLRKCRSVIHVGDRESDSFDLMHAARAADQRFVFRVRVDRRARAATSEASTWSTVRELAQGAKGVLERDVELARRVGSTAPRSRAVHPPRKQRIAKLRFSATQVEIPRPAYLREPVPPVLRLNLVHVIELNPPAGEPPVEWLLYTTEAIDTADDVARIVDIYRTRWVSEEFHAALKGGCAFEEREFESRHALLNILAMSLPIACEVLAIRSYCRTNEKSPATTIFTRVQLQVLRTLGHRPLGPDPTIGEALFALAGMGGHLKRNGPPGWKVLSRGMTTLQISVRAWEAAVAAATAADV
jgi:hypothetical protein